MSEAYDACAESLRVSGGSSVRLAPDMGVEISAAPFFGPLRRAANSL